MPTSPPPPAIDASTPATPAFPDCKPGAYGGVFTGSVEVAGMMFSYVLGTISAQATLVDGDRYLQLADAKAFGIDEKGNSVDVRLTGRIDCASQLLEDGRLEQGTFFYAETFTDFPFAGTLEGAHSGGSIIGSWQVVAQELRLLDGQGGWTLFLTQ